MPRLSQFNRRPGFTAAASGRHADAFGIAWLDVDEDVVRGPGPAVSYQSGTPFEAGAGGSLAEEYLATFAGGTHASPGHALW